MDIQEEVQVKSMFESRFITEHGKLSMKTLVAAANTNETTAAVTEPTKKMRYAPAPAMYWSCPQVFGIKPPKLRAHASVVYGDKMFVYGGTNKSTCSDTLYILELGNKKKRVFILHMYKQILTLLLKRYDDLVGTSGLWQDSASL